MNNNNLVLTNSMPQDAGYYFIVFELKGKKYAVSVNDAAEIINIPEIEIPEAPPEGVFGIFNYKGRMIKAVDLCPFLGFETPQISINGKMIVISADDEYFAVNTENIVNIAMFESDKLQNIPYRAENSVLTQVYQSNNGIINIIDCRILQKLLSGSKEGKSRINYAQLMPSCAADKEMLQLRKQNLAQAYETAALTGGRQNSKQYVLFTMDNRNYYLDIQYVKEFVSLKRLNIVKLPYAPDFIKGIAGIKGEFLTVIDLLRFIYPENGAETKDGKLICVSSKNFNTAFLVDDIKYITNSDGIDKSKISAGTGGFIYAEFMENDTLYGIIDFNKIINDEKLYINIEN